MVDQRVEWLETKADPAALENLASGGQVSISASFCSSRDLPGRSSPACAINVRAPRRSGRFHGTFQAFQECVPIGTIGEGNHRFRNKTTEFHAGFRQRPFNAADILVRPLPEFDGLRAMRVRKLGSCPQNCRLRLRTAIRCKRKVSWRPH